MLTMPSAIAAPSSIILPFGNFNEDYGISSGSSMEKWQAGAEIVKYWVGNATVGRERRFTRRWPYR
jgi:hypothetical protein